LAQTSGNSGWLSSQQQQRRLAPVPKPETFILAFGFVLAGPSLAGLSDGGLPGIGSFTYSGPPIVAPAAIVVAAR
jgi:hypothetical protein